ncbi:MAG: hypothetical protein IKE58_09585, partial [Blautia sp.]|nr:hypothetical protein [Blautia sp.]
VQINYTKTFDDLPAGEYTVTETNTAIKGFDFQNETSVITGTVTVEAGVTTASEDVARIELSDEYAKIVEPEILISKQDIATGEEVAGAHIQIIELKEDGSEALYTEWDSTQEPQTISGLKTETVYILRETIAPENYELAEDTVFMLDANGRVTTDFEIPAYTNEDGEEITLNYADTDGSYHVIIMDKRIYVKVRKNLFFFNDVDEETLAIFAKDEVYRVALYSKDTGEEGLYLDESAPALELEDGTKAYLVTDSAGEAMIREIVFEHATSSEETFSDLISGHSYYLVELDTDGRIMGEEDNPRPQFSTRGNASVYNFTATNASVEEIEFENIYAGEFPDGFYLEGNLKVVKKLFDVEGNAKASHDTFYAGVFLDEDLTHPVNEADDLGNIYMSDYILPIEMKGNVFGETEKPVYLPNVNFSLPLFITEMTPDGDGGYVKYDMAEVFQYTVNVYREEAEDGSTEDTYRIEVTTNGTPVDYIVIENHEVEHSEEDDLAITITKVAGIGMTDAEGVNEDLAENGAEDMTDSEEDASEADEESVSESDEEAVSETDEEAISETDEEEISETEEGTGTEAVEDSDDDTIYLAGAELQILDGSKAVIASWTSTEDSGGHTITGLKADTTYYLHEESAPEGYDQLDHDIAFQLQYDDESEKYVIVLTDSEDAIFLDAFPGTSYAELINYESSGPDVPSDEKAKLKVTKKLEYFGEGEAANLKLYAVDKTFYVALFEDEGLTEMVEGSLSALNIKGASSAEVTYNALTAGTTYYVAEVDKNGKPISATEDGGIPFYVNGESCEPAVAGQMEAVDITNVYAELPDGYYLSAEMTLAKETVALDGNAYRHTGTFYATIFTDKDCKTMADETIVSLNPVPLVLDNASSVSQTVQVFVTRANRTMTLYVAETDQKGKVIGSAGKFSYESGNYSLGLEVNHPEENKVMSNVASVYISGEEASPETVDIVTLTNMNLDLPEGPGPDGPTATPTPYVTMMPNHDDDSGEEYVVTSIIPRTDYITSSTNGGGGNSTVNTTTNTKEERNANVKTDETITRGGTAKTGDDTPIGLYLLLMSLAGAAMIILISRRKRG